MGYQDPAVQWTPTANQVAPVAWMTDLTGNDEFFYGDSGWTVATVTNGTSNGAGYILIGRVVYLHGGVTNPTAGTAMFTLPSGYRPSVENRFIVTAGAAGATCEIQVTTAGTVVPLTTNGAEVWLNQISFPTV